MTGKKNKKASVKSGITTNQYSPRKKPFWKHKGFFLLLGIVTLMLLVIIIADMGMLPLSFLRHIPEYDRIGHIVIYGAFYASLRYFLGKRTWTLGRWPISWAGIMTFIVILLEEVSQLFFSTRTFDLVDIFCGLLGLAIAAHTFSLLERRKNQEIGS